MTNVKCIRCGVVNLVANEVCKVCGVALMPAPQPLTYTQPQRPFYTPTQTTTTLEDELIRPFDGVGDVFWPTFSLFFKKFWLISKIVIVVVAPFEIFKVMSLGEGRVDWQFQAGIFLLDLVCKMLIAPALIVALMNSLRSSTDLGVSEAYRDGLTRMGKLAVCTITSWTLQAIGTLLLIIPGIIIGLGLELVYPIAVLENHSVTKTLKRSWNLTNGHKSKILIAAIGLAIFTGLIGLPISMVLMPNNPVWPISALGAIVLDIFGQTTTVLSLVIYLSILRTLDRNQLSTKIGGDVLGPDHSR